MTGRWKGEVVSVVVVVAYVLAKNLLTLVVFLGWWTAWNLWVDGIGVVRLDKWLHNLKFRLYKHGRMRLFRLLRRASLPVCERVSLMEHVGMDHE